MVSPERASGWLGTAAPLLLLSVPVAYHDWGDRARSLDLAWAWPVWAAAGASLAVGAGAVLMPRAPRLGRLSSAAGLFLWLAHVSPVALHAPIVALVAIAAAVIGVHLLWPVRAASTPDRRFATVEQARAAALVALGAWLGLALGGLGSDPAVQAILGLSFAIAWVLGLRCAWRRDAAQPRWVRLALAGLALLAAGLVTIAGALGGSMLPAAAIVPFASLTLLRHRRGGHAAFAWLSLTLFAQPARVLVITFAGLSLFGTLLLRLPGVGSEGVIAPLDAAFTATSAICVTGLVVVDTPTAFSSFGHLVLLVLIQVGGLGIMSFSTVALAAFGRRLSLRHEAAVASLFGRDRGELFVALRRLLLATFAAELAGAAILAAAFVRAGDSWAAAAWRGLFTSVSAFCNAGFALQSDSLMPYAQSPLVLHTVAILIVAGGLSPVVLADLSGWLRRRPLRLQSKITLMMSVGLLLLGALLVGALEWSNAFGGLSPLGRLHAAWFQSVTLRTAGFNSVDFASLGPTTVWLMTAFMIIGGSPGGTAGGVKTTTAYVLLAAVAGAMRGRWEAVGFGRRISDRTVYKAAAIVTIALGVIVFGVVAVQVTQSLELAETLFEVVSALGTVGLSLGATAKLDHVGKVIIMGLMFVGRVGPLTLFLFLRERHVHASWQLPEEDIEVG